MYAELFVIWFWFLKEIDDDVLISFKHESVQTNSF